MVVLQGLRTFPSMRDPSKLGDFEFEIRYGGIFPQGGPLFCVRQVRLLCRASAERAGHAALTVIALLSWQFGYGEELRGITPDEVWSQVVQKLREVRLSPSGLSYSLCAFDFHCSG